ncbi:hypothetical protein F3H15_35130 [Pseudomonas aeruginosa]|nr:hypothetical protein F3H15_35130 [Pseudomonas aeruginosa]
MPLDEIGNHCSQLGHVDAELTVLRPKLAILIRQLFEAGVLQGHFLPQARRLRRRGAVHDVLQPFLKCGGRRFHGRHF